MPLRPIAGNGIGPPAGVDESSSVLGTPVAVVICSRDRPVMLAEAVTATLAALRPQDELLVVDSASATDATSRVAHEFDAALVRCDEPGLSRARNAGVAATVSPVVAFTDDDCRPQPGWSASLAAAFANQAVGFAFGRVLPDSDTGTPLTLLDATDAYVVHAGGPVRSLGHGANFAVRRSAASSVGPFDELLGAGAMFRAAEDKDYLVRLLAAGWLGQFTPEAVVTHVLWRNRPQAVRTLHGYGMGEGALGLKLAAGGDHSLAPWPLAVRTLAEGLVDLVRLRRLGAAYNLARASGIARGALGARHLAVIDGVFARRDRHK